MTEAATEHAQRRVERARSDLSDTIDALKSKMSVGELVDEVRTFLPSGGSRTMSNMMSSLTRQVQDNPMALVLTGAGLAWLMFGGGSARERHGHASTRTMRYDQDSPYSYYPTRDDAVAGLGEDESSGQGVGERATSAYQSARDTAAGYAERTASATQSAMSSARDAVGGAASGAADTMRSASRSVSEGMTGTQDYVQRTSADLMERYPLVVGAVAIAVGAAIGAALPSTELEDRQLGEASEGVKRAAAERGSEALDEAGAAARRVYDTAARSAEEQGLVPGSDGGPTLAERVEQVGRSAAEAARDELGKAQDGSSGPSPEHRKPS